LVDEEDGGEGVYGLGYSKCPFDSDLVPPFTSFIQHGDMSQPEHSATLKQFQSGATRVLISSIDLLARGRDVHQVSLVINYDMPTLANRESYLRRIGHGGQFGRKGFAISLVTTNDVESLHAIMGKFEYSA
jgi:translation initiation factor 4A